MKYSTHIIVEYKGHRELIQFLVMETSNSNVVLGYNWLQCHKPNVNWLNSTIKLNHCPTQCLLWQKHLGTHLAKNGIRKIQVPDEELAKIKKSMPEEFWEYANVFSEVASIHMPLTKPWDHSIDLK